MDGHFAARGANLIVSTRAAPTYGAADRLQRITRQPPLTIDLVFDNIARWYAGKPLRNVVDRGLRY